MKKFICFGALMLLMSCSLDNDNNKRFKLLPIEKAITPQSFTFKTTDTITVKYSLPNGCHYYHSLYYQYQDTARIVAIRAIENIDVTCTQAIINKELKFPIRIEQKKDYLFKFWKGKDSNGKDIFEEKIVPVK